jgi:hypothetical protein
MRLISAQNRSRCDQPVGLAIQLEGDLPPVELALDRSEERTRPKEVGIRTHPDDNALLGSVGDGRTPIEVNTTPSGPVRTADRMII